MLFSTFIVVVVAAIMRQYLVFQTWAMVSEGCASSFTKLQFREIGQCCLLCSTCQAAYTHLAKLEHHRLLLHGDSAKVGNRRCYYCLKKSVDYYRPKLVVFVLGILALG